MSSTPKFPHCSNKSNVRGPQGMEARALIARPLLYQLRWAWDPWTSCCLFINSSVPGFFLPYFPVFSFLFFFTLTETNITCTTPNCFSIQKTVLTNSPSSLLMVINHPLVTMVETNYSAWWECTRRIPFDWWRWGLMDVAVCFNFIIIPECVHLVMSSRLKAERHNFIFSWKEPRQVWTKN